MGIQQGPSMQSATILLVLGLGLATAFPGKSTSYTASRPVTTHAGDQHDSHDNCVEIINYDEVEYTESNVELCTHSTRRQCRPRTKEICQAVPVKRCELQGSTQCTNQASTVSKQEGVTTQESFTPQVCVRGADAQLTETKEKPVRRSGPATLTAGTWTGRTAAWCRPRCPRRWSST